MKLKKLILIPLSVAACLGLLSSGGVQFWHQAQKKLPITVTIPPHDSKLRITAKTLDSEQSKAMLGRDLIDRGYKPISLTIENHTKRTYRLAADSVDMPVSKASSVSMRIAKRGLPRSIGYSIAGFIFWPFMIPGAINSIKGAISYKKLNSELKAKGLKKDGEVIPPYTTMTRVLYVRADDYKPSFTLKLTDDSNGNVIPLEMQSN
jgi:hypothetical protein